MTTSTSSKAFTLIELSIVMLIIGLIIAGMAQGLKVYYQKIAHEKTVNNIALVEQELRKYLAKNKSYPCPALITGVSSTANYGQADCTGATEIGTAPDTILAGMVPARELGIPDSMVVDGWNRKLSYAVTKAMTVPGIITGDETVDPPGIISVIDKANAERANPPGQAPYVVISHGPDGRGGFTNAGVEHRGCAAGAIDTQNCDRTDMVFRYSEDRSITGDNDNFDDYIGFNLAAGLAPEGDICSLQSKFFVGIGVEGADENGCKAPAPKLQRVVFSTVGTHSWTVPKGVTSAFVTMAGGGGTGVGWRISNAIHSGHSGGFVFSHPVNLTEGEAISVVVGEGGKGYRIETTSEVTVLGHPYYVSKKPDDPDQGRAGYPGRSSKILSPSGGLLLECAGGSGVALGGVDAYNDTKVVGNLKGGTVGVGITHFPTPSNPASGPYAIVGGPGTCGPGPAGYGKGMTGVSQWKTGPNLPSGTWSGGPTPFRYGSGGDIFVSGCYVTAADPGTCISAMDAVDGVVMIDVLIYE